MLEFRDVHDGGDGLPMVAAVAQARERVGGLARLRHEHREPILGQRRLAITEFGRDVNVDRQLGNALEPVFRGQGRVESGAAGRDGQLGDPLEGKRGARQRNGVIREAHVMRERPADNLGLLVDFLRHEVAVVAFVDQKRRGRRARDGAGDLRAVFVEDQRAVMAQHREIALIEEGHAVREGRERHRVGAKEHLALAIADRERAAAARSDHEVLAPREQDRQRKRAAQLGQRSLNSRRRFGAKAQFAVEKMGDHFGIGLAFEARAVPLQLLAQLPEILDDAVMHDGDAARHMRMGVSLDGRAMRGPARVADAGRARERLPVEPLAKRAELSLGAAPDQRAASSVAMPAES